MIAGDVQTRSLYLRHELKVWEKQFAQLHDGRTPGRADIKEDDTIAAKYREYNRLRAIISKKPTPPRKWKTEEEFDFHELSNIKSAPWKSETVGGEQHHTLHDDKENATLLPSQQCIGPTPQKDGRVLGLFDFLSRESTTPTKPANSSRSALEICDVNQVVGTPLKRNHDEHAERDAVGTTPPTTAKYNRTPQSLSKRFLLDSFVTPSKRRRLDDDSHTPISNNNPHLGLSATPTFLNRHSGLLAVRPQTSDGLTSPSRNSARRRVERVPGLGQKRKSLTRSLSTMIAEMRQTEDDRLDEEMDMLREMEDNVAEKPTRFSTISEDDIVEDTQKLNSLGPDGTHVYSDEDDHTSEALGRDGKPLRIWKKRGQKRQTRKVLLRPRARRRSVEPVDANHKLELASDAENVDILDPSLAECDFDEQERSEAEGLDALDLKRKASEIDKSCVDKKSKPIPENTNTDTNLARKVVKKISSTANANFKKLKIRSSMGAKGPGRGRFGRRR